MWDPQAIHLCVWFLLVFLHYAANLLRSSILNSEETLLFYNTLTHSGWQVPVSSHISTWFPEILTPGSDFCTISCPICQKSLKYFLLKLYFTFFFFFFFTTNQKICSNYTCTESGSLCSLHHLQNTAFAFSLEKAPLTGSPWLARKQSRNSEHEAYFHIATRKGCLGWQRELITICFLFWRQRFSTGEIPDSIQMFVFVITQEQCKYKLHPFKSTLLQKEILRSPHKINWGSVRGVGKGSGAEGRGNVCSWWLGSCTRWLLEEGICWSKSPLVLPQYVYAGLHFCVYINSSHHCQIKCCSSQ